MTKQSTDEIRARIKPTLDKVAVKGLRSWLAAIGLSSAAYTRAAITTLVAGEIASGRLAEDALEQALIGFEEASDMRIYLFNLEEVSTAPINKWLPTNLLQAGFAITKKRVFSNGKTKPMSPVYAQLDGSLLRAKWAEEHTNLKINLRTGKLDEDPVERRILLIADLASKKVELRMNPPETKHPHGGMTGPAPPELYFQAYTNKVEDLLGCTLLPIEWRPVIRKLVEEEDPRVVRIHIDNHTNQSNTKAKTHASRSDVRDDPDWKLAYQENGASWAWDSQSFYWLPKVSSGFLTRELYSHIDAETGYVKVNADCSDEEVNYVVSQIRAR